MTLKAILDWANQDSTEDLNTRFRELFAKGVITGGVIVPIVGQLKVSLQPFTALSLDGMLVSNTDDIILDIPTDRTNIIAVYAKHLIGDPALLEVVAIEAGAWNSSIDKDYYVVFGSVTTVSPATEVVETDIDYSLRETQDKRARERIRGQISSILELPTDPNFNVYGDMYIVFSGIGSAPNLYAWNGLAWDNITGAQAVASALDIHQHNLDTSLYPSDPAYLRGKLHVSNDQKDAALGSYGNPSLVNRYITQTDPRIPTDSPDGGQSGALIGSDGTPSNSNRYVTQDYPIAAPTIISNATPVLTLIDMSIEGPVYVGKGPLDSPNIYFALMDYTENKGYLNFSGLPCKINAVYKSVAPFVKLDPSIDPLVDSYGFYQGANLYLGIDIAVDTASRLVYGKRITLKTADHGFPVLPTPNYEIINGTLLSTIANIKGRGFYDNVPTDEQNINLRKDIDNIAQYIGSVLETNVVAGDEDFNRLSLEYPIFEKNIGVDYNFSFENKSTTPPNLPSQFEYDKLTGTIHYYSTVNLGSVQIGDIFIDGGGNRYEVWAIDIGTYTLQIKNIGSLPATYPASIVGAYPESISTSVDGCTVRLTVLTFKNATLVSFTWDATNNWVQFSGTVTLSTVNVGDLFRDGGGTKYLITAVDDFNNRITIVKLETGLPPLSINTSVGNYLDGSTWVNNNPRNVLLSEMKFNYGPEYVPVKKLIRKSDEYSLPDNQIAYGIARFDGRFDPRVVFYGSWENYKTVTGEMYVRNTDGFGKFQVTGYFTDIFIVMRRKTNSGSIAIKVNGVSSATIDPTATNTISSAVASLNGPKFELVKLNSVALSNLLPTTITGTLPSVTTTDSFDVYGFVLLRNANTALLESGRAFESAQIVKRDMVDSNVIVDTTVYQGRGGRLVYAIADNTYSRVIATLDDLDANGTPTGTWTGNTVTITTSGGKLPFYAINDIITIYSTTEAKLCRITNVNTTLNTITVDLTPTIPGETVFILHICSTDSVTSLSSQEDQIARYILPDDFINHTSTDLELIHQSDRFVVGPDNLTIISGQDILVTDAYIIGTKKAVQIQQGSAGALQFTVLATRLDLICVNNTAATILVSIDGSPEYQYTINAMAQRRTIFSNARYQTHEVTIRVNSIGGTFSIAEMLLFGPKKPEFTSFPNIVADLSQLANYQESKEILTTNPNVYPTGAVFKEASSNLSYMNGSGSGTPWAVALDFTKALNYGYYLNTDKEGSYIEFYIENSSFELQYITGPDHGYFKIFIDDIDLANYWVPPGQVTIGNYNLSNGVDGYSAIYGRKNIGIATTDPFLTAGLHKITARISTPRVKNGASSGYKMAFTGFYEGNNNGLMTCGINKYGVYSSIVDTRVFNPLELPINGVQITGPLTRSAKVNLNIGTTSIVVTLAKAYLDSDYIVNPCLVNTVEPYPLLQPVMLTAQSNNSFTITWNVPIPNGNYSMYYFTQTLDV